MPLPGTLNPKNPKPRAPTRYGDGALAEAIEAAAAERPRGPVVDLVETLKLGAAGLDRDSVLELCLAVLQITGNRAQMEAVRGKTDRQTDR
jgi:hypothetical protein